MKRIEALAPLSRDHHHTLILALLLKKNAPAYKGLPHSTEEKAIYAIQQFKMEIKEHFTKEEAILEKVKDYNEAICIIAEEIKKEHRQIEALFFSLNDVVDIESKMDELGNLLQAHIRKEERNLFPLLQQYCPQHLLLEIHNILH